MMEHKLLSLNVSDVKLASNARSFEGYASVFGGVDSYGDTIVRGAYADTLATRERPIKMRWNHWGPVIGKWLDINEDDHGLFVRGELTPGHSVASDVLASLKHGSVDGMSIGFYIRDSEQVDGGRILKKIDLVEISVVEEPADSSARVSSVKSLIDQADSLKELEAVLREAGRFSKSDACGLISRIKSLSLGEQEAGKSVSELAAVKEMILSRSIKNLLTTR
jgi:HK97 family phage prohead protease